MYNSPWTVIATPCNVEIMILTIVYAGVYYHLAKRFAGMRYIFMGKPAQQRPRYEGNSPYLFHNLFGVNKTLS